MTDCAHCGESNVESARFCQACGSSLLDTVRSGFEVRKTVTVLFCDVVGSTALGEAIDPETTRKVMARYSRAMADIVERHGGTVETFRGDEVMAVFGVPVVHEDDALRAVRAGVEMQRRLAELNEELLETWGVRLSCRIGINTGEVVAGDPSSGESFVTGDAVNLAKRLEQAAAAGEILIGTDTYPLVKDAVKVGPRERFSAKGKRDPVSRFRLADVDASAAGYARRLDAPLVGRDEELQHLVGLIEGSFSSERCGVIGVLGPAGIGKSRLARELARRLEPTGSMVTGRCLSYGTGITFWPVVEIVGELGGIDEVATLLRSTENGDVALERVRAAVGVADVDVASDEVFWGIRRLLERLAVERPLVVCLEDLHWAEQMMLDLVEYLAAFAVGPLVLLFVARPDLLELRPDFSAWPALELEQLSPNETEQLVEALGVEDESVRARIATTAEGNALFAEQLAAAIGDSTPATRAAESLRLPASINALLESRLDRLEPVERRALERAAVIGKEFWQRAVADLSSSADRPSVTGQLLALVRKGLIRPVQSRLPAEDQYRFRHALIRDATYAGMPKAVRADLHERFARWLQGQSGRGFGAHDEIVGYHLEQAFRNRVELGPADEGARVLAAEGTARLGAAGKQAFARDDMPAAINLLSRALALAREDDPERLELQFALSGALWSVGEGTRADELLEELVACTTPATNRRLVWHALLERAARRGWVRSEDADDLLAVAEEARRAFAEMGDDLGLARAWRRIAFVNRLQGAFGAAVEAGEQALVHATRAGDLREEIRIVDGLCTTLLYGPVPADEAVERCEQILAGGRGQPALEAAVYSSLAGLVAMQGRLDEARDLYSRAKHLWDELGLRFAVAGVTQVGAEIELLAEDPVAAEHELRFGADILTTVGGNPYQSALLGKAVVAQGRHEEAETLSVEADRASSGHEVAAEVISLETRATVASLRGDPGSAVELAAEAVHRSNDADAPNLRAGALETLARCLIAAGRNDEAAARLEAALRLYEAKGNLTAAERLAQFVE